MRAVYLKGFSLASSMGANLKEALSLIHSPPEPQQRYLKGLEHSVPFYAIAQADSARAETQTPSWYDRCQCLVSQVMTEAGVTSTAGTLFLASSSLNVGAAETGEQSSAHLPSFLTEFAEMLAWTGPVHWINTACTSSLNALLEAQTAIASGAIESALIIGLELENQLSLAGFAGMQLLSFKKAKPFASTRDGLVLGEAVAALWLSSQQSRWRILGGAQVIDSSQVSGASENAYVDMLKFSLARAKLGVADIDLIKVQAAGSIANDAIEAQALHRFFSLQRPLPPLMSLKTLIGHTLGASGAAEIALLLALLEHKQWPQRGLGPEELDETLAVNLANNLPARVRYVLACNLGFGGSHTSVVLEDTSL
jgi:3-oxoacyl-[acyl-carrier-protein] synthase I